MVKIPANRRQPQQLNPNCCWEISTSLGCIAPRAPITNHRHSTAHPQRAHLSTIARICVGWQGSASGCQDRQAAVRSPLSRAKTIQDHPRPSKTFQDLPRPGMPFQAPPKPPQALPSPPKPFQAFPSRSKPSKPFQAFPPANVYASARR